MKEIRVFPMEVRIDAVRAVYSAFGETREDAEDRLRETIFRQTGLLPIIQHTETGD